MPLKTIITPEGENEFQLRILKEEGVGLLTTRSEKSYLILDSLDYWYDLIQTAFPKKKKCRCSSEWFRLQFDYSIREDEKEIRSVQVTSTCANCAKNLKMMLVEFKYSPTLHFLDQPIQYCEKPNIKYKFENLNCYWRRENLNLFLKFIAEHLRLHIYRYYSKHPENTRHFEQVSYEKAIEITIINHRYFDFYFSLNEIIDNAEMIHSYIESGPIVKKDLWRKNELIHLSSPFSILGFGTLYYIHYCAQFLDRGKVDNKSPEFEEMTLRLKSWLKTTFITRRGKDCFDGEEAHKQVMAKLKSKQRLKSIK